MISCTLIIWLLCVFMQIYKCILRALPNPVVHLFNWRLNSYGVNNQSQKLLRTFFWFQEWLVWYGVEQETRSQIIFHSAMKMGSEAIFVFLYWKLHNQALPYYKRLEGICMHAFISVSWYYCPGKRWFMICRTWISIWPSTSPYYTALCDIFTSICLISNFNVTHQRQKLYI